MALNKGLPPSSLLSPSVRIMENDQSLYTDEQSSHRAGLIGFASKGPINTPTLITTRNQLTTVFGYPHPESGDPYMIYAAQQYLNVANELYIVRVADEANVSDERAETASVEIPSSGGRITIMSKKQGPYTFTKDSYFRWKLNGIQYSKVLVILAGTYTPAQLAEDFNLQLTPDLDGIEFITDAGDDYIGVQTTWAFGPSAELEFLSIQDAIYGGAIADGNPTGLGTGMTAATITGGKDRYPLSYQSAGDYDFSSLTDLNIQIVVDGTDVNQIDNTVQVIDLSALEGTQATIAQIVTEINSQLAENGGDLPGGWIAEAVGDNLAFSTTHHGRDARLLIKPDSTAAGIFGLDSLTKTGDSPRGTSGSGSDDTLGRVNGDANTLGAISLYVYADSAGIDGNATTVTVQNNVREGNFSIFVSNNDVIVESIGGLVKDENSRFYVETYISLTSDWIRISDNRSNAAPPLNGTYILKGGSDGIPSNPDKQDELLIGKPLGSTGMYALSEPEQIDIDLIAIPAHSSTSVVTALIDFCQNIRGDCLAIIDPPFGLGVSEIVDWQNGQHPLNTTRFDSDFAALFWPWVKIRDHHNLVDIWAPPSGSVMATIARSDQIGRVWFAPAGESRGIVNGIDDVFSRPTLAERDLMYGSRNCINPIVQFVNTDGFIIWGQKTLQRRKTATDRINVRRLLIYIRKQLQIRTRQLLFEPHDDILRQKFIRIATTILSQIQVERGIYDFRIKCDEEINTPDVIDRNEMRAKIGVQPVKAMEFLFVELSIHRTGSFGEGTDGF